MKHIWIKTTLALAVAASSSYSLASGFALNEQSISAMGTSFAGRSSSADDATTVFGNPAGMSRLKREQASVGAAAILAKTDISRASGSVNGSNDGDMVPFTGVPLGYYVKPIDDSWTFGIGVYVPFGLITDYEHDFQGRFFGDYSEVKVITAQPTVSYRFNEQLSFGLGLTINRIEGELRSSAVPFAESRIKIKGDDTALGYNVGVLYEFNQGTRVGLTYHSMVDYKLEGHTKTSGGALGNRSFDATLVLKTPESVDFSLTHELDERWTLYAGSAWTRWSRLKEIRANNKGVPAPLQSSLGSIGEEQGWHNTWSYAFGASYTLNPQWVLRTGLAFDQSPTNNQHRSPRIPTNDRTAISFGAGWSPNDDVTVDLAYSYLWEDSAKIDQSKVSGGMTTTYQSKYKNKAHGFGAQLTYRF